MTRFVVDPLAAIKIIRDKAAIAEHHQLVGPSILRSDCLSILYREVRAGELDAKAAHVMLDGITSLRIRLLGDRASRATAWKIAHTLDWEDICQAEYLAVTQLQADAFITLDPTLAGKVESVVPLASFGALLQ